MAHQEPGERFAESEDRYRAAMEDTPALVCCFRTTGEVTYVNEAYCRYFRKAREELVGCAILPSIAELDRQAIMSAVASLTVGTPTRVHEQRTIGEAGKVHWQRWTLRALFDRYGALAGFEAHGEDITESRRAGVSAPAAD